MGILMPISIFWLNHGSRFYYFMKREYHEKTRSLMTYDIYWYQEHFDSGQNQTTIR